MTIKKAYIVDAIVDQIGLIDLNRNKCDLTKDNPTKSLKGSGKTTKIINNFSSHKTHRKSPMKAFPLRLAGQSLDEEIHRIQSEEFAACYCRSGSCMCYGCLGRVQVSSKSSLQTNCDKRGGGGTNYLFVGGQEESYRFIDVKTLVADFHAEIEKANY